MRSATLCLVALVAAAALAGASELPSNEEGPRACVSGCAAVACPCPANTLPADCAAACDATRSQCVTDCFSDTVAGVVDTRGPCDEPTHDQCVARCHSLPLPPYGRRIVLNQCLETCPAAPAVVEVAPEQDQDEEGAGRRGRNGNSDQYARCINRCMGLSGPDRDSCYGSCSSSGPHPDVVEVAPEQDQDEEEQQCIADCNDAPCKEPWGCKTAKRDCIIACQMGNQNGAAADAGVCTRASCAKICYSQFCIAGCGPVRKACLARCPAE